MNKLHEITFLLAAKASSANGGIFKSTATSIGNINDKLNEMNAQKVKVDKYADLSESVETARIRVDELKNSESELVSKIAYSDSEISKQKRAVDRAEEAYLSYKLELQNVGRTTEEQRAERNRLKEAYSEERQRLNALRLENRDYARELQSVRRETSITNQSLDSQAERLQRLGEQLSDSGIDTQNLVQHQSELAQSLQGLTDAQQSYQDTIASRDEAQENTIAYAELTAASVGLVAALAKPTKSAMAFESAMADVKKVVNFDSPDQFKQMSNDIMDLSTKIPMVKEDIAAIVSAGGQAGLDNSELLDFAESAAKMGVAFDVTASEAGDLMANWRSAFKMNQDEVNNLADKINYLGNTTAAAAPEISDIVSRIGPLGDVGGVTSGSIAALGATMVSSGVSSEIAATGIKNMILNLTKGEAATDAQKDAFKKLGTSSTEMAKTMQTDSEQAITGILNSIGKLPEEEQISIMNTLFGSESVAPISTLFSNLDTLKENMNRVADSTQYAGSMEAEFQSRADTSENAAQLMSNSLGNLSATFGQMFIPAVKAGANTITEIAAKMREFMAEHPVLTKLIGYSAAGIGVLSTTVFGLLTLIAGGNFIYQNAKLAIMGWNLASKASTLGQLALKAAMLLSKGAMLGWTLVTNGASAAMRLLNLAMAANPIGLVVMGIVAFVTILVVAYNKSEKFRNIVNKIKDKVVELGSAGFEFITGKISAFKELLGKIKVPGWIKTLGKALEKGWDFVTGGGGSMTTVTTSSSPKTHLAKGGIVKKPTYAEIGEGGEPEAVIPLSKLGTMAYGINQRSNANAQSSMQKIEYKPTYVFKGGNPTKKDLLEAETMSQSKFNKMMAAYEKNKRRTNFSPA